MFDRRTLLAGGAASIVTGAMLFGGSRATHAQEGRFQVRMTEAQWRKKLSPAQFAVLREEETERPGSSPLN